MYSRNPKAIAARIFALWVTLKTTFGNIKTVDTRRLKLEAFHPPHFFPIRDSPRRAISVHLTREGNFNR